MTTKLPDPPPILDDQAFVRELLDAELEARSLREAVGTIPESMAALRKAMLDELAIAEQHLANLRRQARAEVQRRCAA